MFDGTFFHLTLVPAPVAFVHILDDGGLTNVEDEANVEGKKAIATANKEDESSMALFNLPFDDKLIMEMKNE